VLWRQPRELIYTDDRELTGLQIVLIEDAGLS
jgi:hypothetical protein